MPPPISIVALTPAQVNNCPHARRRALVLRDLAEAICDAASALYAGRTADLPQLAFALRGAARIWLDTGGTRLQMERAEAFSEALVAASLVSAGPERTNAALEALRELLRAMGGRG